MSKNNIYKGSNNGRLLCKKKSSCLFFLLCENLSCFSHNDRIHAMIIVCSFSCSQVLFKIKCSIQLETSPILLFIPLYSFFPISPFVSICPLSTLILLFFHLCYTFIYLNVEGNSQHSAYIYTFF